MEMRKRLSIFLTFVCFCLGVALISAAFGTQHWFESRPRKLQFFGRRNETQSATPEPVVARISTSEKKSDELDGENLVYSGLFSGLRIINYHLGPRIMPFEVREELEHGTSFMSMGIWISVILFCCLSMLWAVVGIIFSLVNTIMKPIETITGPLGLYVWSSLAAFCGFVSIILYLVQFFTTISHNVLLKRELDSGISSDGNTWLGYSFWMLVGSVCCFLLNIILLLISGMEMKTRYPHKEKEMPHIADGGVLMY